MTAEPGAAMMDEKLLLDLCIMQLDEGVLLANHGASEQMHNWAQAAAMLLHKIREVRRNAAKAAHLIEGE